MTCVNNALLYVLTSVVNLEITILISRISRYRLSKSCSRSCRLYQCLDLDLDLELHNLDLDLVLDRQDLDFNLVHEHNFLDRTLMVTELM